LFPVGADPDCADSTIFWQYQCLDPDVEMVRGGLTKLGAAVQRRMDAWLRLQQGVQRTVDRLEGLLCTGGEGVDGGREVLVRLTQEVAEKWAPWYNHFSDFFWARCAELVQIVRDRESAARSQDTELMDWRKRLQESLNEYDRTYLRNTLEAAQIDMRRLITRAFVSS
jgi:hypothetical protein